VDVQASASLVGLPVLNQLPGNRFWLWLPGSSLWLERRICRAHLAVRAVTLERLFDKNRVVVHLEPRVPLVRWNGSGLDREGVLFAITPGTWQALAEATFPDGADRKGLGAWLFRLAGVQEFWPQVTAVREDLPESLSLTMKNGTRVIWGPLETEPAARKAQTLLRVLDDAHKNMGGTAQADLRFFDQGRIIVLPKGVRPSS
jgi:cell division septal protein FtsQ